jgi:uridine kinase
VPAGLDGDPNPVRSAARDAVLDALADEVEARRSARVLLVAVDGTDGGGKTTFADELGRRIEGRGAPVIRSTIDSFHRPRRERWARGRLSDVGFYLDSHDLDALRRELLEPLVAHPPRPFRTAVFDEPADEPVDSPRLTAEPGAVLLFDGLFLQRPELVDYWDLVIYIDGEERIARDRIERGVALCGASPAPLLQLLQHWAVLQRYVGGFRLYKEECGPALNADAVVVNNDLLGPTLTVQVRSRARG